MRLHRVGAKHQPSYRIVITPALTPRDGSYLDQVGFYNPRTEPATLRIDTEKVVEWLKKGVQPTDRVIRLLESVNIVPEAVRRGEAIPTEPVTKKERASKPKKDAEQQAAKAAKAASAAPVVATAPAQAAQPEPQPEVELTELAEAAAQGTAVEEDLQTDGVINESPGSAEPPEAEAAAPAASETPDEVPGTEPSPDPAEAAAESADSAEAAAPSENASEDEAEAEEPAAKPARKRASKKTDEPAESE